MLTIKSQHAGFLPLQAHSAFEPRPTFRLILRYTRLRAAVRYEIEYDKAAKPMQIQRVIAAVRLAWTVALLAVLAECAFALDPNHRITQYGHTAWTVQDGRLPGSVYALAQTKDGWLWVGTAFGLLRFDGVRFSPLAGPEDEPARTEAVSALAPDPSGGLWIGTRHSLSHWSGSAAQRYQTVDRALGAVNSIHV